MAEKFRPFSNGTQFLDWEASNCERCTKFNPDGPSKCKLRHALLTAYWADGSVSERVAKGLGYLDNKGAYVWPCGEVEWTEEWKYEWNKAHS